MLLLFGATVAILATPVKNTAILLVDCPDQKGIVAAISDFLYRHNANIIHNDQHQDADLGLFLTRVEWDLSDFKLETSDFETAFAPIAGKFGMRWTQETAERHQSALLKEHKVDFVALARYMQILTGDFVALYPQRIINVHHSFLPAFGGAKPYHRAFERGVKLIGATSHYVTEKLDEGPIIEQDVVRISHRDQLQDLIQKGRDIEKAVLSRAVRWHIEHRILVYAKKTVVFD